VAEINPAAWLQSRTDHPAILHRRVLGGLLAGHANGATVNQGGIASGLGDRLSVSGSGSAMQVTVGTGGAFVAGTNAWQGVYYCVSDSNVTLNISAAHATQFRRDLVVARVLDTAYGDGSSQWQLEVVQGTNSASSPAPLPTQPATSEFLAVVNVDPGITNLSGKVDSSRRSAGAAKALAVDSTKAAATGGMQASYAPGTFVWDQASGIQTLYLADSSQTLRYVAKAGTWTTYTPTISNGGAATYTTRTGRWMLVGEKACAVKIRFIIGTAGSGSGILAVGLPFTPNRSGMPQILPLHYESSAGPDANYRLWGDAMVLESGSGAFFDRLYVANGNDLTNPDGDEWQFQGINGSDLPAGSRWLIQGVYEVA
jgi:hypothetical protein